ncbi:hypothetical protein E2C01_009260 [Portunus trituberculatus]|uniref:Uncharacterized protein n=1 Tax=Portunus trituberculatus TaxID=210409 RepID=A0A5B7D4V3_PORTR|nr:hypothetical protein [Portunus trituberculatus]
MSQTSKIVLIQALTFEDFQPLTDLSATPARHRITTSSDSAAPISQHQTKEMFTTAQWSGRRQAMSRKWSRIFYGMFHHGGAVPLKTLATMKNQSLLSLTCSCSRLATWTPRSCRANQDFSVFLKSTRGVVSIEVEEEMMVVVAVASLASLTGSPQGLSFSGRWLTQGTDDHYVVFKAIASVT